MAKAVVLCDDELFIVHEIFYFCLSFVSIKTPTITIAFTNLNYSPLGAACSDVFNQQRVVRKYSCFSGFTLTK